jgi:hypothetical protein
MVLINRSRSEMVCFFIGNLIFNSTTVKYIYSYFNRMFMTEVINRNKFFKQKEMIQTIATGSLEELRQYFIPSEITNNELYSDLQFNINNALKIVASSGNFEKARYLLTSPKLNIHADIHFDNNDAIDSACYWGHKDLVDYLLHSSEIKENAKLPQDMDKIFNSIIMHTKEARNIDQQVEYLEFLTFLINDCQVRPTEKIIDMIEKLHPSFYEPAIKQLAQNELYHSLQDELGSNMTTNNKKAKI